MKNQIYVCLQDTEKAILKPFPAINCSKLAKDNLGSKEQPCSLNLLVLFSAFSSPSHKQMELGLHLYDFDCYDIPSRKTTTPSFFTDHIYLYFFLIFRCICIFFELSTNLTFKSF